MLGSSLRDSCLAGPHWVGADAQTARIISQGGGKSGQWHRGQFKHPPCQEDMKPPYGIKSLVGMQTIEEKR